MLDLSEQPIFVCVENQASVVAPLVVGRDVTVMTWSQLRRCDASRFYDVAIIEIAEDADILEIRRCCPHALMLSGTDRDDVDFVLRTASERAVLPQVLNHALTFWRRNRKIQELGHDVAMRRQRMHQLNEISMALTGQMSQQELLHTILSEARRIARVPTSHVELHQQDRSIGGRHQDLNSDVRGRARARVEPGADVETADSHRTGICLRLPQIVRTPARVALHRGAAGVDEVHC